MIFPPSRRVVFIFLAALFLSSCASQPVASVSVMDEIKRADSKIAAETQWRKEDSEITAHPELLIELNDSVAKWIRYFSETDRERFARFLDRGSRYKTMVQETLRRYGIPKEVYYLAMIESGYQNHAVSRARAVGIWQFLPGTAKDYGLRVRASLDERRDPLRATQAAARYLKDLYNVFGSWRLAMAAYNAGQYRILSAIMRGKTRDFWTLAERGVLPPETMDYVPRFLAATIIGENPKKYGFHDVGKNTTPREEPPRQVAAYIPVSTPVLHKRAQKSSTPTIYRVRRGDTLTEISARFGIPIKRLKKLNRLSSGAIYSGQALRLRRS